MVGLSVDPVKVSYRGLGVGDTVQLEDNEGVMRECSIYNINCQGNLWNFDLYVPSLELIVRGVDVADVRHIGGRDAPFVLQTDVRPQPAPTLQPLRPSIGVRVKKTSPRQEQRRRRPRRRRVVKSRFHRLGLHPTVTPPRRTWGVDDRFIPGTPESKKRAKQRRTQQRRPMSAGVSTSSKKSLLSLSMGVIKEEPESKKIIIRKVKGTGRRRR